VLGLDSLVEVSRGFPVVQAEVELEAQGYGAVFAWIQVVRMVDLDCEVSRELVDLAPQLAGLDLPYLSFGVRPILLDAPSTAGRNLDWDADAFLVVTPDGLMTRWIRPLCGFTWGYRLHDGEPKPVQRQAASGVSWSRDRDFLADRYPSWTFEHQTDETASG